MKPIVGFSVAFAIVMAIDQWIKFIILDGFRLPGECIDITYALNTGVAFSMFAFLGPYLKYIQLLLITAVFGYIFYEKLLKSYWLPLGMLLGAGVSNLLDRFMHGGVVDYVYWHCGFDFAIFNFADVMIDISVALILYIYYIGSKKEENGEKGA